MRSTFFVSALAATVALSACVVRTADPDEPRREATTRSSDDRPAPQQAPPERESEQVPVWRDDSVAEAPVAERRNERVPARRGNTATPTREGVPVGGNANQPVLRRNERVPARRGGVRKQFRIEPTAGPVGTTVTIFGDFRAARRPADLEVSFHGSGRIVQPTTIDRDAITAIVPQGAQSGPVQVRHRRRVLWTGQFSVTPADDGIFVPTPGGKGLVGLVYRLAPQTKNLPDFAQLGMPFATIVVPKLDVPTRRFEDGFPGLSDGQDKLVEWFAIRFEGQLQVPSAATYEFQLSSDDGSRLYIDGQLVIDNDGIHPTKKKDGAIALQAGNHDIVVEYFQGPRVQIALQLLWKQNGSFTPVGAEHFTR